MITTEALWNLTEGRRIESPIVDVMGAMINAESRGAYALDTSTSTALYEGRVPALSHPSSIPGAELLLLPFRSQGQWRLGIADIPRAILYNLAFE